MHTSTSISSTISGIWPSLASGRWANRILFTQRPLILLSIILLFVEQGAHGQIPNITGISPKRNQLNTPLTTNVAIKFDQALNNEASTLNAVKIFSRQRGGRMQNGARGITIASGNTLAFTPTNKFLPGETIFTTVTSAVQSSGGVNLARGHVYQFTTGVGGTGGGNFQLGSDPDVNLGAINLTIGDVDGDGDLDLITANNPNNTVGVQLNGGDATGSNTGVFSNTYQVPVGLLPRSVVLGDIDGDGDLDLLAANSNQTVSIRLNGGDASGSNTGTFSNGSEVPAGNLGSSPTNVVVGDIDGDGDLDMVTANSNQTVSVRLNGGDATGSNTGTFSNGSEVTVSGLPFNVVLGDVDGDGDLDLITANIDRLSVRLNGGNATGSNTGLFSNGSEIFVNGYPWYVAIGDVDGDGDLDLITANFNNDSVSVRLNGGDATGSNTGTFSNGSEVFVGIQPRSVALGDVGWGWGSGCANIKF